MTETIKLDANKIKANEFLEILNNVEQSDYGIWEGRLVKNLQGTQKYSYENLLNVFKSFDRNTEHRDLMLLKLRKLDQSEGFITKIKEFVHSAISTFCGTYIDKDEILETWLHIPETIKVIPEITINETEISEEPQEEAVDNKTNQDEQSFLPDEPEIIESDNNKIRILDDQENSKGTLPEEDPENTFSNDQSNQSSSENQPKDFVAIEEPKDPSLQIIQNIDITPSEEQNPRIPLNDEKSSDEKEVSSSNPKPNIPTPRKIKKIPSPSESSSTSSGLSKLSILAGAIVGFAFAAFFNALLNSKEKNLSLPIEPFNCSGPTKLNATNLEIYKNATAASNHTPVICEQLKIALEKTQAQYHELLALKEKAALAEKEKLLCDYQIQIEVAIANGFPIEVNDPVLHSLIKKQFAKDPERIIWARKFAEVTLNSPAANQNTFKFLEELIIELTQSHSLQKHGIELLFAYYTRRDCTNIPQMHLKNVFATPQLISVSNLNIFKTLILNSKIDRQQIKEFAYASYLNKALLEEHKVFFDFLLLMKLHTDNDIYDLLDAAHALFDDSQNRRSLHLLANFVRKYTPGQNIKERILEKLNKMTLKPHDNYLKGFMDLHGCDSIADIRHNITQIGLNKINFFCGCDSTPDELGIIALTEFLAQYSTIDSEHRIFLSEILITIFNKEVKNQSNIHNLLHVLVKHDAHEALITFLKVWLEDKNIPYHISLKALDQILLAMEHKGSELTASQTNIAREIIKAVFSKPFIKTYNHTADATYKNVVNRLIKLKSYDALLEITNTILNKDDIKQFWDMPFAILKFISYSSHEEGKQLNKTPKIDLSSEQHETAIMLLHKLVKAKSNLSIDEIVILALSAYFLDIPNSSCNESFTVSNELMKDFVQNKSEESCAQLNFFLTYGAKNKNNPLLHDLAAHLLAKQSPTLLQTILPVKSAAKYLPHVPYISKPLQYLFENYDHDIDILKHNLGLNILIHLTKFEQSEAFWLGIMETIKGTISKRKLSNFPEAIKLLLSTFEHINPAEKYSKQFYYFVKGLLFDKKIEQLTDPLTEWRSKYPVELQTVSLEHFVHLINRLRTTEIGITPIYELVKAAAVLEDLGQNATNSLLDIAVENALSFTDFSLFLINNIETNTKLSSLEKLESLSHLCKTPQFQVNTIAVQTFLKISEDLLNSLSLKPGQIDKLLDVLADSVTEKNKKIWLKLNSFKLIFTRLAITLPHHSRLEQLIQILRMRPTLEDFKKMFTCPIEGNLAELKTQASANISSQDSTIHKKIELQFANVPFAITNVVTENLNSIFVTDEKDSSIFLGHDHPRMEYAKFSQIFHLKMLNDAEMLRIDEFYKKKGIVSGAEPLQLNKDNEQNLREFLIAEGIKLTDHSTSLESIYYFVTGNVKKTTYDLYLERLNEMLEFFNKALQENVKNAIALREKNSEVLSIPDVRALKLAYFGAFQESPVDSLLLKYLVREGYILSKKSKSQDSPIWSADGVAWIQC